MCLNFFQNASHGKVLFRKTQLRSKINIFEKIPLGNFNAQQCMNVCLRFF